VLHRARIERRADLAVQLFALRPVFAQHADLDQLVTLEGDVDFMQYRRRQAGVADHDDRVQVVGPRAQRAPLDWSENLHRQCWILSVQC